MDKLKFLIANDLKERLGSLHFLFKEKKYEMLKKKKYKKSIREQESTR